MKALALVVFASAVFAGDEPARELTTQAVVFPHSTIPWFRHGYLITHPPAAQSGAPASTVFYGFWLWKPDGSFAYQKNIEIPEGTQPVMHDLDIGSDGAAVVAASALGGQSRFKSGLLLLDPAGELKQFVDTGRYFPGHVAIAPDGSIWTLGWQNGREDYRVVHSFRHDGRESNAFLPRASFVAGLEPGSADSSLRIMATNDRVGIWVFAGQTGGNREWIEMDRTGSVLFRMRTDGQVPGGHDIALTADDRVFLSGRRGELYELDRAARTWKMVWDKGPILLGSDGNQLVFRKAQSSSSLPTTLQWFELP